jgi:dTDP-4-dehydrorhamnose reductase
MKWWRRVKPDVIIHTAAMTQVDLCESEPDKAFRVNVLGSANVAASAARWGARIIAISTDYVFDGCSIGPITNLMFPRLERLWRK